jgi:hypothetical protein
MVAMIGLNRAQSPEMCSTDAMTQKVGQKRPRRAVTFSEEVKSRETYSSDQVQDCWYHQDDYQMFRKEMRKTVELVKYNVHIDDIRHCQRGLEKCFKEAAEVRRKVQDKAWFVVLRRQHVGQGTQNATALADSIAEYYATQARTARMSAYLVGIADERAALSPVTATVEAGDVTKVMARPRGTRVDLPPRSAARRTIIPLALAA